jgi:MYXO-CTERM domain-containing protein
VCDPGTGLCSDPTAPDGTACDDGDACTRTDACQAGVCQGQDPIDCGAPPACNSVACDPQSGQCELSPVEDGTACDDGSLCTTADACQAGACQGSPVECQAPDACHTAACDPEDGQCDVQPIPDGGACDDQNPCTLSDTCQAGECIGSPVECQALDACHLPGVCNRATGLCSDPTAANGTPCAEGVCWEGVCGPAPWDTDESGCGCAASGARLPAGSALPGLLFLAALGFLRRRTSAR